MIATTATGGQDVTRWRSANGRGNTTCHATTTGTCNFRTFWIEYGIDGRDHTLDVEVMTPHYPRRPRRGEVRFRLCALLIEP